MDVAFSKGLHMMTKTIKKAWHEVEALEGYVGPLYVLSFPTDQRQRNTFN